MSARLWDKGQAPDAQVHSFTVGDDPHWDRRLAQWDCVGSAAQALTLRRAGLVSAAECDALLAELGRIAADARAGRFEIPRELEDCHTAIEARLVQALGETGHKIHAGRSRNDQVATAIRLYLRDQAARWAERLAMLIDTIVARIGRDGAVPMPGYTHLQPAMPSSVGLWLQAAAEALLEQMHAIADLARRLDSCPLGTGAGFGCGLPLDRLYTAELLGFARVQRSPIDVQNSRGRMELYAARVAVDIASALEKPAWDMILGMAPALGFFSLPEALTTGSSLMPQKRNPDVLELLRAQAGRLRGLLHEIEWISGKLPSSYHRDLQLCKGPAIQACETVAELLPVATRVFAEFQVHEDRLRAAMTDELYATQAALDLVQAGVPFRQAYRQVAEQVRSGRFQPPAAAGAGAGAGGGGGSANRRASGNSTDRSSAPGPSAEDLAALAAECIQARDLIRELTGRPMPAADALGS
jgi:argininosuccinate lyase